MVEDSITDGKRIAQLLASELTGLETGPLAAVEVVDAETAVVPDESGPVAYQFEYRDSTAGRVRVYPNHAVLHLDPAVEPLTEDSASSVTVQSGAGVKDAVDVVRDSLRAD